MKGATVQEYAARSLDALSPMLQREVVLQIHRHWIDSIWFMRGVEEVVLTRLVMGMSWRVLGPGETAPLRALYVVWRGCVLYGWRVATAHTVPRSPSATSAHCSLTAWPCVHCRRVVRAGMAWGDDVLCHSSHSAQPREVQRPLCV
jgi:hypothetical protein